MNLENDKVAIQDYLASHNFLNENEIVLRVEIPGEGNMNFTLRVISNERSFILKQSRAYVEKYPQVAAPADRCMREAEFYALVAPIIALSSRTPEIWHVDKENHVLIMDDLGQSSDYSFLYQSDAGIEDNDLKDIMEFAAILHTSVTKDSSPYLISNKEMRKLNHEHIYIYPFLSDSGFNLDEVCVGLSEVALKYQKDMVLKAVVHELGKQYLADGETLLHGDYFLGSWLKSKDGIKIIDPEFCYFGVPEFEIGVTVAHLIFARQSEAVIARALKYYTAISPLNLEQVMRHAGVEIMRRIMGLAQLPLKLDLQQRSNLLDLAYSFIVK